MNEWDKVIPLSLVVTAIIVAFIPNLCETPKTVMFCVALFGAITSALLLRRSRAGQSSTQWKVKINEISFSHYERSREDRPPVSEEVTELYDEALEKQHSGNFADAARLFRRAFEVGEQYWPAKINESFCYGAMGQLERALAEYDDVLVQCTAGRFRRQALGNSGNILMEMAKATESKKQKRSFALTAYERFAAARAVEEAFVSMFNLWQAAAIIGKKDEAEGLLIKLKEDPKYWELPEEQREPPEPIS